MSNRSLEMARRFTNCDLIVRLHCDVQGDDRPEIWTIAVGEHSWRTFLRVVEEKQGSVFQFLKIKDGTFRIDRISLDPTHGNASLGEEIDLDEFLELPLLHDRLRKYSVAVTD